MTATRHPGGAICSDCTALGCTACPCYCHLPPQACGYFLSQGMTRCQEPATRKPEAGGKHGVIFRCEEHAARLEAAWLDEAVR